MYYFASTNPTLPLHPVPLPTLANTSLFSVSVTLFLCRVCFITQSRPTLCNPVDCTLPGSSVHGDSAGKNTGVACHAFVQGIFPSQGSNPGLLHCRQILYHLSHQGSPWILEWVAYPFSRGSSWPRSRAEVSFTSGWFISSWATRETLLFHR